MSEDNIAIRLKILIAELGINSSVFADNCGISRATLSQLLTGRNKKISDVLISQIHKAYPSLSILWLLFNEGPMWNNDSGSNNSDFKDNKTNPLNIESNDPANSLLTKSASASIDTDVISPNSLNSDILRDSQRADNNDQMLNLTQNKCEPKDTQQASSIKDNTFELVKEIEMLRKKIRKVVQITIYYDDSTFETFYPK